VVPDSSDSTICLSSMPANSFVFRVYLLVELRMDLFISAVLHPPANIDSSLFVINKVFELMNRILSLIFSIELRTMFSVCLKLDVAVMYKTQ